MAKQLSLETDSTSPKNVGLSYVVKPYGMALPCVTCVWLSFSYEVPLTFTSQQMSGYGRAHSSQKHPRFVLLPLNLAKLAASDHKRTSKRHASVLQALQATYPST